MRDNRGAATPSDDAQFAVFLAFLGLILCVLAACGALV
ncbi:hypothetical protein L286_23585 [Sphingobium sp. HDIP04]|nr:hypothetical protein L286_23585 [Sphingobium sp. HDIP04]